VSSASLQAEAADARGGSSGLEGELPFAIHSYRAFHVSLIARYKRLFGGMILLMGVYSGIVAGRLLVGGVLLDSVILHFAPDKKGRFISRLDSIWSWLFGPGASVSAQIPNADFFFHFLLVMIAVFCLAAIAMAVAFYYKEYLAQWLIVRMTVDIRKAVFRHLSYQSVAYFNRQRSGDLISRLTNDVSAVQLSFRFFFEDIVQQPIAIVSALAVALASSPLLFIVTVPFYGVLLFPVIRSGKKVIKHGRGRLEKLSLVTESIQQLFGGIRIVKAFGMESHEQVAFGNKNQAYIRSSMRMNRAKLKGRSLQELLYNLGTAALLLLGVFAITYELVGATDFSIFLLALVQIYNPLKTLSRAWNQIQESRPGLDRVLEILREKPLIQYRDGSEEFPGVKGEIRFEDVSFSYKDLHPSVVREPGEDLSLPVLSDVSFGVKVGEVAAFVGPSGAGKSTIVDLLARFYDPQRGRILVDGRDIREYRYAAYLRSIAIVSQDPFLFNTTIRENIRYGREAATDDEVEEAARVAYAHDFIMEQPEGYDTIIGDRGVMLSGGQRQRLTIARAVLKNAPILILDEATSSLDSQAEKEVQEAIDNLIRARTTFVIAHRLSTVVRADKIFVVADGRIVESGRHEELLERKGKYRKLWISQNPDA
jgi:subfamily B ATP-binding cassette protein MsbA